MEMSSVFSERDANFTRITGDRNDLYVNDFEQTAEINFNCKSEMDSDSTKEKNAFELDSPFFFMVLDIKTEIPLLIGKLSNPNEGTTFPGKQGFCKIPHVENGFVIDNLFYDQLLPRDLVDVESQVYVQCNPGYDLQTFERYSVRTCNSQGWDDEFPKCKSNIRLLS